MTIILRSINTLINISDLKKKNHFNNLFNQMNLPSASRKDRDTEIGNSNLFMKPH